MEAEILANKDTQANQVEHL